MNNSDNDGRLNELTVEIEQLQRTVTELNQEKNDIISGIKFDTTKWFKKWIGVFFGGFSILTIIALIQIYLSVVDKTEEYMTDSIKEKFAIPEISKTLTEVAENQAKNIIDNTLEPSIKSATELIDIRTANFETTLNDFTTKYDAESDILAEEIEFLKKRNDVLKLVDEAIATGLAEPYDKLFESYTNPETEQEKMWALASIHRIKAQFGLMTRLGSKELVYTHPVTGQKLKENKMPTEGLLNDFHEVENWKIRGKILQFLKSRKEFGVPECILTAMKDDHLEVRKLAMKSFKKVTGYNGDDIFGSGGTIEKQWWDRNKIEVEKKFKKLQTIEDAFNKDKINESNGEST